MAKIKFCVGAVTDVGLRRANNEDNFFVPGIPVKDRDVKVCNISSAHPNGLEMEEKNAFFAVCDGMGGHNAGEYASHMAVQALQSSYDSIIKNESFEQTRADMDDLFGEINHQMNEASHTNVDMRGMGSTLCSLYFFGGNKYIPINIGDSRVYMVKGSKLVQLSVDHSDKSTEKGALTRYLGLPEEYGEIGAEYGIKAETLVKKTRFLLCSDGLTDMVKDEEILHHLKTEKNPAEAAEKLTDVAKKMGGIDNITAVVIDATPVGKTIQRALRRPLTYGIAAAVIIAAAGGYVCCDRLWFHPPVQEERVGVSLNAHNEAIKNAGTIEELIVAIEGENGLLNTLKNNYKEYVGVKEMCYAAGMKAEDYAEYKDLNDNLYNLQGAIDDLEKTLENAKGLPDGSPEKLDAVNKIKDSLSEGGDLYTLNETMKKNAEQAKKALNVLNKQKEEEQKAKDAENKKKNQNNNSGGSTKKKNNNSGGSTQKKNNNSGGSSGGSGGSSGSSGGSSGSSGGSSGGSGGGNASKGRAVK